MAELLRTVQAGTLVRGDIVRRGKTLHRVTDQPRQVICPIRPAVEVRLRAVDNSSVTHLTVDATDPVAVLVVKP